MKASLDTNIIIHFYRAGLQEILFNTFDEGLIIYEQLRTVELAHHGKDILKIFDDDVAKGKITIYTEDKLKELGISTLFHINFNENLNLYEPGDLGEIYAISLAQTLGAYSLITDDIKLGGPYMSLLQFKDDVMPFNYVDILILRYISGKVNLEQTANDFKAITEASQLNWSLKSNFIKFIERFLNNKYREDDKI